MAISPALRLTLLVSVALHLGLAYWPRQHPPATQTPVPAREIAVQLAPARRAAPTPEAPPPVSRPTPPVETPPAPRKIVPPPATTLPARKTAPAKPRPADTRPMRPPRPVRKPASRPAPRPHPPAPPAPRIVENTQKTLTPPAPPLQKTAAETAPPTSSLPQHTPALSASAKAAERHDYLDALAAAIAHNRHYPRLSRRRGEEGQVVVGFHIAADGHLERLRVLESSNRPRLDRAALTTVRRTSPFSPPPAALTSDEREIRLPVVFRLR